MVTAFVRGGSTRRIDACVQRRRQQGEAVRGPAAAGEHEPIRRARAARTIPVGPGQRPHAVFERRGEGMLRGQPIVDEQDRRGRPAGDFRGDRPMTPGSAGDPSAAVKVDDAAARSFVSALRDHPFGGDAIGVREPDRHVCERSARFHIPVSLNMSAQRGHQVACGIACPSGQVIERPGDVGTVGRNGPASKHKLDHQPPAGRTK